MNSQLAFNSTRSYRLLTDFGKCIGFLCGKPVYQQPNATEISLSSNIIQELGWQKYGSKKWLRQTTS